MIQAGPQRRDILGGGLQSPGSVRPGTTGPTAAPGQQQHEQPLSRLLPTLAKTDWQLAFLPRQLSPASRAILPLLGQSTKARGQRTAEAAITRDRLASEQLEISCGPASSQDPRHSRQAPQPSPRLRANGPSRERAFPRMDLPANGPPGTESQPARAASAKTKRRGGALICSGLQRERQSAQSQRSRRS